MRILSAFLASACALVTVAVATGASISSPPPAQYAGQSRSLLHPNVAAAAETVGAGLGTAALRTCGRRVHRMLSGDAVP